MSDAHRSRLPAIGLGLVLVGAAAWAPAVETVPEPAPAPAPAGDTPAPAPKADTPAPAPAPRAEETLVKRHNYAYVPAPGWIMPRDQQGLDYYAMRQGSQVALIWSEGDRSPEEIVTSWRQSEEESWKTVDSAEQTVIDLPGGRACECLIKGRDAEGNQAKLLISLSHQGHELAVFLIVPAGRDVEIATAAARELAASVRWLADRPQWLADHEGVERPLALAGGLIRLGLRRPRWRDANEQLTSNERDWQIRDLACYAYHAGSAWLYLRAETVEGDAEARAVALAQGYHLGESEEYVWREADIGGKTQRWLEVSGTDDVGTRVFRVAVRDRDGLRAVVTLEAMEWRYEDTAADWAGLLGGLSLGDPADPAAAAWPWKRWWQDDSHKHPDARLGADLTGAERIGGSDVLDALSAVSADGRVAVYGQGAEAVLGATVSPRPVPLQLKPVPTGAFALSADGSQIAWVADKELCVRAAAGGRVRRLPVEVAEMAFTADGTALIATTALKPGDGIWPSANRLVEITLATAEVKVLADAPLARWSLPSPAPTGTLVAVSGNVLGDRLGFDQHVLVVDRAAPGTWKALTTGPGTPLHLAWSGDALYALRVRSDAGSGTSRAWVSGAEVDLWRLDPTGAAEPLRLTSSGRFMGLFAAGAQVFLGVSDWALPDAQRGLWRLTPGALKAAGGADPLIHDLSRQLGPVMAKAAGVADLATWVPTEANVVAVADAFAATAAPWADARLDFTLASLPAAEVLAHRLHAQGQLDWAAIAGLGAYYGETLRRSAKGRWALRPVPLAAALPGATAEDNALVTGVRPFADPVLGQVSDGEAGGWYSGLVLSQRDDGDVLLLVHPASDAGAAITAATDPQWLKGKAQISAGEVDAGLDTLSAFATARPKADIAVSEVFRLLLARGDEARLQTFVDAVVAGGSTASPVLTWLAERQAPADPAAALKSYRQSLAKGRSSETTETLEAMATLYRRVGDLPMAECCLRRLLQLDGENERKSQWLALLAQADKSVPVAKPAAKSDSKPDGKDGTKDAPKEPAKDAAKDAVKGGAEPAAAAKPGGGDVVP